MKIKEQYRRFKEWQQHPIENKESHEQHHCNNCGGDFVGNFCPTCGQKHIDYVESHEQHHCSNCGGDFTGNFCPTCGQKWNVDNITWNNLRQDVMDFRGFGTLSPIFTLWQLLLRPGYLIGDYISGKRQLCYPPLKLLVMVGAVAVLVDKYFKFDLHDDGKGFELIDGGNDIDMWLTTHIEWTILMFFGFMILPTFMVFRYSPRHSFHTLPQGFYIQLFQSIQFLCLITISYLLYGAICKLFGFEGNNDFIWFYIPLLIILFYNYKQLFGYNYWNTLWRIVYCWMLSIILGSLLIYPFQKGSGYDSNSTVIAEIILLFLFLSLAHIINVINRCNYGQQSHRCMRKWYNILIIVVYGIITSLFLCYGIAGLIKYIQNPDAKRDDYIEIEAIIMSLILAFLIGVYIVEARKPDKERDLSTN